MFPHLDHENLPDNSMANAEKWAAGMPVPGYAIDDQTAIKVIDGEVSVVSEAIGNGLRPKCAWQFRIVQCYLYRCPSSQSANREKMARCVMNKWQGFYRNSQ